MWALGCCYAWCGFCADVTLDVDTLTAEQEVEINSFAHQYGMKDDDFVM